MAKRQWNFQETSPAGTFAPAFPGGFHVGVVSKCEEQKPEKGSDTSKGNWITIVPHPQYSTLKGVEARVYLANDDKNGFTMKLMMDIMGWTEEQIKSKTFEFDPCDPQAGLAGHTAYIEVRKEARADKVDPTKKYDDIIVRNADEQAKAQAAGGTVNAAPAAGLSVGAVGATLPTNGAGPALAGPVVSAAAAAPGSLPGLPGLN